jgi:hypothetical protein
MVRACSIEQRRGAYRVFVGKSEASRPFGRPRSKRKDNIKTDLRVVVYRECALCKQNKEALKVFTAVLHKTATFYFFV